MNLEQTIQTCFDNHAPSIGNRKHALIHLFCTFGTGYEWKNGELVDSLDLKPFTGTLDNMGKASQLLSTKEVALKLTYKSLNEDGEGFNPPCSYEQFSKRVNELELKLEAKGITLEDSILKESFNMINLLRDSHEKYVTMRTCKKYSPMFNAPADIKEDWANGIIEIKSILKELNIDLESIA